MALRLGQKLASIPFRSVSKLSRIPKSCLIQTSSLRFHTFFNYGKKREKVDDAQGQPYLGQTIIYLVRSLCLGVGLGLAITQIWEPEMPDPLLQEMFFAYAVDPVMKALERLLGSSIAKNPLIPDPAENSPQETAKDTLKKKDLITSIPDIELSPSEMRLLRATAWSLPLINQELDKKWTGLRKNVKMTLGKKGWTKIFPLKNRTKLYNYLTSWARYEGSTPIDCGKFLEKVLKHKGFNYTIVDGFTGVGKTTAMLLLCSHFIQSGRPAIFISCSKDPAAVTGKQLQRVKDVLLSDPLKIDALAKAFYDEQKYLTIVIDDFDQHYSDPATEETATKLLAFLIRGVKKYDLRVIFTSSKYEFAQSLRELMSGTDMRVRHVRMPAPQPNAMNKFIKETLELRKKTAISGNSDEDIAMYCEVVGSYPEIRKGLFSNVSSEAKSVRELTLTAFQSSVTHMKDALSKAIVPSENKQSTLSLDQIRQLKVRLVNQIFEKLFKDKVLYCSNSYEVVMSELLESVGIVRYLSKTKRAVEFCSFAEEVAARALFSKPVPDSTRLFTGATYKKRDYYGRGTDRIIASLAGQYTNFEAEKKVVETAFKESSA